MTSRENVIYYAITGIVFISIVLCSILFHNTGQRSNGGATNEEKQSVIAKFNEFAPIIEALSVSGSFFFLIWATCFRKTERDRLDDLKFQIGGLFAQNGKSQMSHSEVAALLESLDSKFQRGKYRRLIWYAYKELINDGKVEVLSEYDAHIQKTPTIEDEDI